MKRWLTILLLTVAAAVVHASSDGTTTAPVPSEPVVTATLSAGDADPDQFSIPLDATVATSGASQLAGNENAPGKIRIRHASGHLTLPAPGRLSQEFHEPSCKYPTHHSFLVAFARPSDYYIYTLRRIII